MWMTLSITAVSGGYCVWFALRMESHRPFFLNYIILSPLFLTLISQWKLNEKAIGSPFYYCHLCFLSREVRLPDLRGLHFYLPSEATSKGGEKNNNWESNNQHHKEIDLSHWACLKLKGCRHASTFLLLLRDSVCHCLMVPFTIFPPPLFRREKVLEETRIPDGGREGGGDVRLR